MQVRALGPQGQQISQRVLSEPFVGWRSHVQDALLRLPGKRVVGSIWLRGNMIHAVYRGDTDDSHTLSMSGFGQARSLRPSELAQASVMGALCAAIAIIAVVLPHAGGLGLLGAVPMGLLAYRYRVRVLITGTVAAGVIGFLVVGLSGSGAVALCAYVGGLAGIVKRRGHGAATVTAASFGAGIGGGAVGVVGR